MLVNVVFILSHIRSMGFTSVVGLTAVFVSDLLVFVLFGFLVLFLVAFSFNALPLTLCQIVGYDVSVGSPTLNIGHDLLRYICRHCLWFFWG